MWAWNWLLLSVPHTNVWLRLNCLFCCWGKKNLLIECKSLIGKYLLEVILSRHVPVFLMCDLPSNLCLVLWRMHKIVMMTSSPRPHSAPTTHMQKLNIQGKKKESQVKLLPHYWLYHLMWRTDSLEKTLMLEKIEGKRRRGWQRMRWLASSTWWTWVWASFRNWWWIAMLQSMGLQRVGYN